MSSTVHASCSSGFESGLLDVGGGMLDLGQMCLAPALSDRSGKLVVSNIWGKKRRGSRAEDVVFYTDPRLHPPGHQVPLPSVRGHVVAFPAW